MHPGIEHINPDGLFKNPAFSQIVTTQGSGKTIYIGGQNAVNANREIIGKGHIEMQTEQAIQNIKIALAACNATINHVIKFSIHIVQGQELYKAFQVAQKFMADIKNPPIVSVLVVAGLANPDFLIEIEAIAFIPA